MKIIRVTILVLIVLFVTSSLASQMGFFSKKDTAEKQTVEIGKCNQTDKFVMVIHGGAGYKEYKLKEKTALIKNLLDNCKKLLHDGATSLDVVHFAIREMEDSGLFNAGKGSRKNKNGFLEMDASIMDTEPFVAIY